MNSQGRCPTHDLALSPAGDCVLCRRHSARPPAAEAPGTSVWGRALGGIAIVAVAAVIAVSGVVASMRGPSRGADVVGVDEPMRGDPSRAHAATPQPGARPDSAEPSPWEDDEPSDLAFEIARDRVSITMYSTSWCGACRAARAYFDDEGIAYRELDVERDRSAAMRMRELNPRGGVPTIDIEGQVLVGFSSRAIEDAIDTAARRRL